MDERSRVIIGCMTGTSLDGLDCVVARVFGRGLRLRAEVIDVASRPLGRLAQPLRALAQQQAMTAGDIAAVMRDFSLLHVAALRPLHQRHRADLVCVHGQTVFHAPPLSWQLFQPAPLAWALNVPVLCDLRAMDVAAGGQGAPITPLADWILYRRPRRTVAVVNLGGFANGTIVPPGGIAQVRGGDWCACNHVLDAVARVALNAPFDRDGRAALRGVAHPGAARALVAVLERQRRSLRSLGTGDEAETWVRAHVQVPARDLARSACAAVAEVIARALGDVAQDVVLAGGGARNRALVEELRARCVGASVRDSAECGIPAQAREGLAFAVLGALCQDRVAITMPAITGVARAPLAGCWVLP